eukprot:sb/3476380/
MPKVAVLHSSGDVMEGDSGRVLQTKAGLLSPPADKSTKVRPELADNAPTFTTPFGDVKLVNLAEVAPRTRQTDYEDIPEKVKYWVSPLAVVQGVAILVDTASEYYGQVGDMIFKLTN